MKGISDLDLESPEWPGREEKLEEDSIPQHVLDDGCHIEHNSLNHNMHLLKEEMYDSAIDPVDPEMEKLPDKREDGDTSEISEACDTCVDDFITDKQLVERRFPNAVLPLLRHQQCESSESSSRYILDF